MRCGAGGYNHGEATRLNYVGNYIIPRDPQREHSFTVRKLTQPKTLSKIHLAQTVSASSAAASADNRRLLEVDTSAGAVADIVTAGPAFDIPAAYAVRTDAALVAYERVLAEAGATHPKRDAVDRRVVDQVRRREGRIINTPADVGGYPSYASGVPPADRDNDGLPDEWERAHGLNPADPTDGARLAASGYSQLEEYLNALAAVHR